MKNIPKKIYLNTQFDPDLINHLKELGKSLSDILLEEATWSPDKIHESDIEYILATPALKAANDERQRQIDKEGYNAKHDDEHVRGELALAAAIYALPDYLRNKRLDNDVPISWPWDEKYWKPSINDRKREITKAMALLIDEYERLERLEVDNE